MATTKTGLVSDNEEFGSLRRDGAGPLGGSPRRAASLDDVTLLLRELLVEVIKIRRAQEQIGQDIRVSISRAA